MSSKGFGQWYDDKKAEENPDEGGSSSWFGSSEQLPLFSNEAMQSMSFCSMKASMESQMPKQILGMGYQQRFQVFCGLLFLSALFFAMAFFVGVPTLVARPQKFAISFTLGSLTFMASFGILKGPMEHLNSMIAPDRLWFTLVYVGSMFMTLYLTFTVGGVSGYLWVLSASATQMLALMYYLISFLPGGASGLKYVTAAMGHFLKPVLVFCARAQAVCLARFVGWFVRSSANSD